MKKKLGKNSIYQEGTLVAYGCSFCNCASCNVCTNCNSKSPTSLGTIAMTTVMDGNLSNSGLPFEF